jgi:coenzyme F420 biosynthesis associated uncharacterized protein
VDDLPLLDPAVARAVGASLTPAGPAVTPAAAEETARGLRVAAEASVLHVAAVTGLGGPDDGSGMLVVDRPTWLAANVEMVSALLSDAAGGGRSPVGGRERATAVANGVQVGGVLALLSRRILGQFLPFGPPRLLLVAPNVAAVERELGVVPADFRLWVCLHEQTHRLQFARAPWLREHLTTQFGLLLDAEEETPAPRVRRLPSSLADLVISPAQRPVFDRLTGVMSLLEGYADVMMDRVGPEVVPTVEQIRRRFDAHRARGGWVRVVNRLMGLELKLAQYRDGAAFCRAVIGRVGVEGLNAVYSSPALLPTLEEIHHPDAWVDRAQRVA